VIGPDIALAFVKIAHYAGDTPEYANATNRKGPAARQVRVRRTGDSDIAERRRHLLSGLVRGPKCEIGLWLFRVFARAVTHVQITRGKICLAALTCRLTTPAVRCRAA
jgi:hypothetical protein